jgi:hypothetical protein
MPNADITEIKELLKRQGAQTPLTIETEHAKKPADFQLWDEKTKEAYRYARWKEMFQNVAKLVAAGYYTGQDNYWRDPKGDIVYPFKEFEPWDSPNGGRS